ncbi:MAG: hypothetical protein V1711_02130 [bacterium]
MNHKRFWIAASIIAGVVVISFVLSVPHTRDIAQTEITQDNITIVPSVTLHDSFKKGVHTITGSLEAPNACSVITANAILSGNASSADGILVEISMPPDAGVCLQLPTKVNFSTTVSAPAGLPLSATVNGYKATTTIL